MKKLILIVSCLCLCTMSAFAQFEEESPASPPNIAVLLHTLSNTGSTTGALVEAGPNSLYLGRPVSFQKGNYSANDMQGMSKKTSYLIVNQGFKVTVYTNDNLSGESATFVGPTRINLTDNYWNEKIASMKIVMD